MLVPGLGANPEESWKSPKGFNWTTSDEALIRDFPKSRVLLFMYESAWYGALKVKSQVMSNIAKTLLVNLQSKRKVGHILEAVWRLIRMLTHGSAALQRATYCVHRP